MTTALGPIDQSLRDRANLVVPGGMYGHMRAGGLPILQMSPAREGESSRRSVLSAHAMAVGSY